MSIWPALITNPSGESSRSSLDLKLIEQLILERQISLNDLFSWTHPIANRKLLRPYHGKEEVIEADLWAVWLANQKNESSATAFLQLMGRQLHTIDLMKVVANDPGRQTDILAIDVLADRVSPVSLQRLLSSLDREDIETLKTRKVSPLCPTLSIHSASDEQMDVLLQYGWDIDQPDSEGMSSIFRAKTWKRAKALLDRGASVTQVSAQGKTVMDIFPAWGKKADELREIGGVLDKMLQEAKGQEGNEDLSLVDGKISRAFSAINAGVVSGFPQAIKALEKLPNTTGKPAMGHFDQTFVQSLVKVMAAKGSKRRQSVSRSYIGFANHLLLHADNPWIDLNFIPDPSLPTMTQKDHLMMGVLYFAWKNDVNPSNTTANVKDELLAWAGQRIHHIIPLMPQWCGRYIQANPYEMFEAFVSHGCSWSKINAEFQSYLQQAGPENPFIQNLIGSHFENTYWEHDYAKNNDNVMHLIHEYGDKSWLNTAIQSQYQSSLGTANEGFWTDLLVKRWMVLCVDQLMGRGNAEVEAVQALGALIEAPEFLERKNPTLAKAMAWWFEHRMPEEHYTYYTPSNKDKKNMLTPHDFVNTREHDDPETAQPLIAHMERIYMGQSVEHTSQRRAGRKM